MKHRRTKRRFTHPIMRKGGYHDMKKQEAEDLRAKLIREYGTDDLDELRRRAAEEEYE